MYTENNDLQAYLIAEKQLSIEIGWSCLKLILYFCLKDKVMNTKLTLTIEQSIVETAEKYARKRERSLSELIENNLKALVTHEDAKSDDELTPTVKHLRGSFKLPENLDYKNELTDRLSEKYL